VRRKRGIGEEEYLKKKVVEIVPDIAF